MRNKADNIMHETILNILAYGEFDVEPRPRYKDGTPAHTKFLTNHFESYDIENGDIVSPSLRPTAIKSGIKEILWIYQKASNDLSLAKEMGINWWNEWDVGDGTIGKSYGYVVSKYDLVNKLLDGMIKDPYRRFHKMDLYQETEAIEQAELGGLQACFYRTDWSVRGKYIDVLVHSRSNDYLMAGAINRTQYLALAQMVVGHLRHATGINYKLGKLDFMVKNIHIYDRHFEQAKELLNRPSLPHVLNTIELPVSKPFWEYTVEDWVIVRNTYKDLSTPLEIAV